MLWLQRVAQFSKIAVKKGVQPPSSGDALSAQREKLSRIGRVSSNLKMGIVGMANVGKSSTFNLLSQQSVPAENFPFCTIDPNLAIIILKDERFDHLCELFKPKSKVPAHLSVTDIAGYINQSFSLVKGASEGHGLGNEFLSHIQQVDGLYQMVRAFENDKILHTEGNMDPLRDLDIISGELVAKDLAFVSKRATELAAKVKRNEQMKINTVDAKTMALTYQVLEKCNSALKNKKWVRYQTWTDEECVELNKLQLLTAKPSVYLINLSKEEYIASLNGQKPKYAPDIQRWIQNSSPDASAILFSVEFEKENKQSSLSKINQILYEGYRLLNLIKFFTVGQDEVRSWTIKENIKAPKAASVIHTDFEKVVNNLREQGFIGAEIISYEEFHKLGSSAVESFAKKMKKEGKDYVIKDGDIINFKCKIVK